ncbi:MAG: alpha/beta hydrolase [Alphaproteobacteria bacterium]|jgi:pimeloyl-ACP methyl ester carboxylesterase|nr:alpha/beta hydrolase [Rhodospirillaceae bacterium]MBT6205452.1 alpha/beta hydrolase [Rhodospirillaceae bacterium]MBT6512278.1 alpha/beta hydrolase [Rhodospirillaceae bacterium]MDG2481018.1 alpha/beta hydrolase [Alphaproteobacteria bacterium]
MPEALQALSDGASVLLRRQGNPAGMRILVSHGTGFAVDGFRRMWEPLCVNFDVITFDLRHHGRNLACDPASINAERQNADMREVLVGTHEQFGIKQTFGLFHSISALAALRVETRAPGSFAGLVLIEPPAPPPAGHPLEATFEEGRLALAARSARRQERFESIAELASKYAGREPFSLFEEGAGEELARSILVQDGVGWRLACSPDAESRYYTTNFDDGLFDRADAVGCRVLMLAGRNDLTLPGTPAQLAGDLAQRGGYDYLELADATHMMPLERPGAIAAMTNAFIASV